MRSMGSRRAGRLAIILLMLVLALGTAACAGTSGPGTSSLGGASASPGGASSGPGGSGLLQRGDVPDDAAAMAPGPMLPDPGEGGVPPYERTTPVAGRLTTGAPTTLAPTTIGSEGGTVEALGLRIEVPKDTLTADTTFAITSAPISTADFGGLVRPVTPLYRIEDGGVAFAGPVTVTLLASIPEGATAMAFYFEEATGTLTPLIPIAQDGTSLTAGATHFSGILGAIVELANLPAIVDSGFRPGIDDWQFTNYGSYAAPGGQCEGQSVSEAWYYATQRLGAGASPLHGLHDNNSAETRTPTFWPDDSDGYRFVGSVQASPLADPFTYDFLKNAMYDAADGRLTYDAFRAAIALAGRPQLISVSAGPGDAGHAMVVYRVTPQWLLIADPNYPGIGRRIRFDPETGKLGPFVSGNNATDIAAGRTKKYTRFAYVPWESSSSEDSLTALWTQFESGTAGDAVFPGYDLLVTGGQDAAGKDVLVPWTDGYATTESSIDVQVSTLYDGSASIMYVYPGTSSVPMTARPHFKETLQLVPGENAFGVAIWGKRDGAWKYVDFVRLTVNGPAPTPTPIPSPTPSFTEPVRITINVDVPIGGSDDTDTATCPAEVTLAFTPSGGDPTSTGAAFIAAAAGLWAGCTNVAFTALDAAGTFDGRTFALEEGRWSYTGTFDGSTATITGGPKGVTLVFPVGP